ncbi:Integrase catalytic domain-containing protein [Aphis craccivora]|uniref:Integrase catalytic domain-containing protein n=1 Tax=Aphis craccivora TaxID=307492 RepID=A0A6G0VMM8_APHCR|nr:Integrase catalytic domain-containing protein [Aphis craccivora]
MNITSFNTLNVDDCTPLMSNKIEKIPIIKLLRITETKQIQFQACYIIADYLITSCAGFDDAQIVKHGYFTELIQGAAQCADAHFKRAYTFYQGTTANNIKINQTMYFSDVIRGRVNHDGDCTGETFKTDIYELEYVLVQAKFKILLSEGMATANSRDNVIILPTGTRLRLSDLYGIDSHKGEIIWTFNKQKNCDTTDTNDYDTLYEGPATLITSKKSLDSTMEIQTFQVESDKITFALQKLKLDYACHIPVFQTEHPRLFILVDQENIPFFHTKPISTYNTDLMAYINTKFVYIQNILKTSITSMYIDLVTKQCNLERQILMQKLSLASYSLSEFAYSMAEGPGYTALKSGKIVYLLKCKPVDVELDRSHNACFQELPVLYN